MHNDSVVTHCDLGSEFLRALKLIVPDVEGIRSISLDPSEKLEEMRGRILAAIRSADDSDGVLILTDMFGGTPSNVALSFHDEHHVEIVTGMNLPMLVKLATLKDDDHRMADVGDPPRSRGGGASGAPPA